MQVIPSIDLGGAEMMAVTLAQGLRDGGLSTSLISLYDCPPGLLAQRVGSGLAGITYGSVGKRPGFDWRAVTRLSAAIRRDRIDIVHTHQYALRYVLAARALGPRPCHVHTLHTPEHAQRSLVNDLLHRVSQASGTRTVAVAPTIGVSYTAAGRYDRVLVVPNGVDTTRFRPDPAKGLAWRRELQIAPQAVVLVCVARFHPLKNHAALIRGFAAIAGEIPGAVLVLAGDGPLKSEAEATVRALGLADRVRFLGATTRVGEVLAGSDVFALTSHWEGNPISILEAMAAGLPIIAPAVGGIGDVVRAGVDGCLFAPGDDGEFHAALRSLLASAELRSAMGRSSRERVVASFSVSAMVDGYRAIYDSAMSNDGSRRRSTDDREGLPAAPRSTRRRVLSVIPGVPRGSLMIFAHRQSKSLADAGHDVEEFHLADRTAPLRWLGELVRLRRSVRRFKPDIVHAHYGTVTAITCALAKGRRPLVVTYRGSDLNPSSAVSRLRSATGRLISQVAALFAAEIICVSDRLRGELWWRRRTAHVIPSGVDTELFRPWDRSLARRELGIDPQLPVVVFNCGHDPWVKRLELAEAVMQHVQRELADVQFVVMRADWEPTRVPLLLSAADCLLVTSRREGSPNIVKEAMACGLPIVSVDVGDVAERISGLANCHLAADRADALGPLVVDVLQKAERSNGRGRALAIDSRQVAADISAIYEQALARRR